VTALRGAAALACLWLLSGAAAAQEPARDPAGSLEALLQELARQPARPLHQRIAAVRAFLQRHEARQRDVSVLRARLRLGALHLEGFDAESARMVFAAVRELAPADDHDLRGRALYGLAQAQELHGDRATARATLASLVEELPGTCYAEWATIARNLLDRDGLLLPGQTLPALVGGEAVDGRLVRPARMRGRPLLLVAFAPDHAASLERLVALQDTWIEGGMPPSALIAYALGGEPDRLRRLAQARGLRCTILPCPDGFLHPDLLAMGVTGVPSALLVGAGHELLVRDPAADRLRILLAQAR
jgi:hypothetical protein